MKYKVINTATNEEHLCDKVTIDGFDYYVSDEKVREEQWYITKEGKLLRFTGRYVLGDKLTKDCKQVIATNNPNIDIPKVVDEVKKLAESIIPNLPYKKYVKTGFIGGYNKSQETHPFSEEDLIGFAEWAVRRDWKDVSSVFEKSTKELLEMWKEQRPKTVYCE